MTMGGPVHEVSVSDSEFQPSSLSVSVGDVVRWRVVGPTLSHVIVLTGEAALTESEHLSAGKSFEHRFDRAGHFVYSCALYTRLSGRLNVAEPASATLGTQRSPSPGSPP